MKNMQWTLVNGKRILVNLDRIDAVIEHGTNPKTQTVICFGSEEYTILGSYDEIIRHIPSAYFEAHSRRQEEIEKLKNALRYTLKYGNLQGMEEETKKLLDET